jgi:hypothetical protein
VSNDYASVNVPEQGGVGASGDSADLVVELLVDVAEDGTVTVASGAAEHDPSQVNLGPPACQDAEWNVQQAGGGNEPAWNSQFQWRFKRNTTPGNLTPNQAEAGLVEATKNITQSRNSCDLADNVDATQSYQGNAGATPDIGPGPECLNFANTDGESITAFAGLAGFLAFTCWWWNGNYAIQESDTRIDAGTTWYVTKPAGCSGQKFDLEAVMTHERGHTFSMTHVSEGSHGNLTMSRYINGPCQNDESSLGKATCSDCAICIRFLNCVEVVLD